MTSHYVTCTTRDLICARTPKLPMSLAKGQSFDTNNDTPLDMRCRQNAIELKRNNNSSFVLPSAFVLPGFSHELILAFALKSAFVFPEDSHYSIRRQWLYHNLSGGSSYVNKSLPTRGSILVEVVSIRDYGGYVIAS